MAGSRAEAVHQIEVVRSAFEELRQELEVNPVRDDIFVGIEIGGASAYYISGGRLRAAQVLSSSGTALLDSRTKELERRVQELQEELEQSRCDVRIRFKDEKTLAELVTRVRDSLRQNDIPRILSSLLCEMTLPTWGGGLRDVEVSGVSSLARLLWSAWLSRETDSDNQRDRERAKQSWLDEDLSQGWVMVPYVSPGIKDRVAMFQNDLENLHVTKAHLQKNEVSSSSSSQSAPQDEKSERLNWMEELVMDLYQTAEQFRGTVLPSENCVVAPLENSADTTDVSTLADRVPPPRSSLNFL